jgi:hypothetical protein
MKISRKCALLSFSFCDKVEVSGFLTRKDVIPRYPAISYVLTPFEPQTTNNKQHVILLSFSISHFQVWDR